MYTVTDKKQQQNALTSAPKHADSIQSANRPSDALYFLQRNLGNSYLRAVSETDAHKKGDQLKLQTKLEVGSPDDVYEQEADRVAEQVLAAPGNLAVSGTTPGIQRYAGQAAKSTDTAPASVDRVLAGSGRPLDAPLLEDMESRFGHDFSRVRVHLGGDAEQSARDVNAHAYTVGNNVVFGAGRFEPSSQEGRRLIAHELTHVLQQAGANGVHVGQGGQKLGLSPVVGIIQHQARRGSAGGCGICINDPDCRKAGGIAHAEIQASFTASNPDIVEEQQVPVLEKGSGAIVRRQPSPPESNKITKLRELLKDDKEEDAISLMGNLTEDEVMLVLASREFKELAIISFNNAEMYRGVKAMRGDLYKSLEWMFDEGTDWDKAKDVIIHKPSGKDTVRADYLMMRQFVGVCNNEEIAETVDLLGGTLLQKLRWMQAEGSEWKLVKTKLEGTNDAKQKEELYKIDEMRNFFIDVCDKKEMAEAVELLGGTLLQKMTWMEAKGTDWKSIVLPLLRGDPNLSATILTIDAAGMLGSLIERVDDDANRRELLQILGTNLNPVVRSLVEPYVEKLDKKWQLQFNLGRLGVTTSAPAFNSAPFSGLISSDPSKPFTGVGATGVSPLEGSISQTDQFLIAAGKETTVATYSNPIPGSLPGYLATLSAIERAQQAELMLRQPISSVEASSYVGKIPSRAQVIAAAAKAHKLKPQHLAAFLLAEQRDQSKNEDAKDYLGATSRIFQGNTSIGLGQVVVSTAQKNNLFQDLLFPGTQRGLSHDDVALLLASDEFNIFAAARYIRKVADDGSMINIITLPITSATFPGINMPAFALDSSIWPDDNLRALASEYTSKPWDDNLSPGWSDFVFEAYNDVIASGVTF